MSGQTNRVSPPQLEMLRRIDENTRAGYHVHEWVFQGKSGRTARALRDAGFIGYAYDDGDDDEFHSAIVVKNPGLKLLASKGWRRGK